MLVFLGGCVGSAAQVAEPEAVWGRRGLSPGRFATPRAIAIDAQDRLYIVDKSARIQVFTREGKLLAHWRTPEWENGKPTGLGIGLDGTVMVADTHYFRVLFYTPQGKLLPERTLGGVQGRGPGQFDLVTDVVQDADGYIYVAQYGDNDRIQKFTAEGKFVLQWGGHGSAPGQFRRPQSLVFDARGRLWVADACNHRLQVFSRNGRLLKVLGGEGSGLGQFRFPYDLAFDPQGNLYVVEFGNHRVQKFSPEGKPLATWGTHGRGPGQLHNPWAIVCDSQGVLHVLDTYNNRVQRVRF